MGDPIAAPSQSLPPTNRRKKECERNPARRRGAGRERGKDCPDTERGNSRPRIPSEVVHSPAVLVSASVPKGACEDCRTDDRGPGGRFRDGACGRRSELECSAVERQSVVETGHHRAEG